MNFIKNISKRLWLYLKSVQDRNTILGLELGELLEGEVLGPLSNRKVAVRIKGACVSVQSGPNLIPGDMIVVKVAKLEPKIVFRLLFKKNSKFETIEARA